MREADQSWEILLARLFTDVELRARFERDPRAVGTEFGLDQRALAALENADWVGLDLAAKSYAHKRSGRGSRKSLWRRLFGR